MIEQICIVTLWIWGIKAIHTHPFIFWKQGAWLDKKLPRYIVKPLFRCPVCMSSVHGTYFFLYFDMSGIMNWIVFLITLAGIQFLIVAFLYPEHESEILEEEQKKS